MKLNPGIGSVLDFEYQDFELVNYQAHPGIKAEISV
jgi:thymidylate synthase